MADDLRFLNTDYDKKYGFHVPHIAVYETGKGLSKEVVEQISKRKKEPEWMLQRRLQALEVFKSKPMPTWGGDLSKIDFDNLTYYLDPTDKKTDDWKELPAEIKRTFDRLGIPEAERKFLGGSGAQFESTVVYHKLRDDLAKQGVIFLDTETGLREHESLFKEWFGKVVSLHDNKFAALNTACWSGGTFIYIPPGVKVTLPLQAYFRINAKNVGQFERTLIIADKGSEVTYYEGCLPVGEEVILGDRQVTIETIEKGQTVINSNGEETTVEKTMVRPYDGDLIEITPVSVGNTFRLTPEHPILAIKRSRVWAGKRKTRKLSDVSYKKLAVAQPEFVDAGKLEEGDFLVYPVNKVVREDSSLTDAHLRFLGYYLSEGYTRKINNYDAVMLSFNDSEREYINDAKQSAFTIIGKTPSEFHDPKKHELRLTVYSTELRALCEQHCGRYAGQKKLSKAIMELPPDHQKILLTTYYNGDGNAYSSFGNDNVSKRNGTVFRALTVSRTLAFQLQELLSRQGIYASINIRKAFTEKLKNGKVINHQTAYIIYYQDLKRFVAVKKRKDCFLVPVTKIHRNRYQGDVYNFHVATEPNTYLVKGFAVHNCTSPIYSSDSLHSAVVELVALEGAKIRYTTMQNWFGNVYNLVTKRAYAYRNATVEWLDLNMGSKLSMKYPSVYMIEEGAKADILSIAYAGRGQHQDTGGKVVHLAPHTTSRIVSKSISKDGGRTSYRGLLEVRKGATGITSNVRCDALLLDEASRSDTYPLMKIEEQDVNITHEAFVGKVGEEQLFYLMSRGLTESEAMSLIVLGFIAEFTKELPMDYAIELNKLVHLNMEGSVG